MREGEKLIKNNYLFSKTKTDLKREFSATKPRNLDGQGKPRSGWKNPRPGALIAIHSPFKAICIGTTLLFVMRRILTYRRKHLINITIYYQSDKLKKFFLFDIAFNESNFFKI